MKKPKKKWVYDPREPKTKAKSRARKSKPGLLDQIKIEICEYFIKWLEKTGKQQLDLAKKLKLDPAIMSKIIRKQPETFKIDRLLNLLHVIHPELTFVIRKRKNA